MSAEKTPAYESDETVNQRVMLQRKRQAVQPGKQVRAEKPTPVPGVVELVDEPLQSRY